MPSCTIRILITSIAEAIKKSNPVFLHVSHLVP